MKCNASNFFQIDCSPAATRLASHYDQVVFYNTASGVYNSIQVKNVYNYSDARAKININPLGYGLNVLSKLNAVSYDFKDKNEPAAFIFNNSLIHESFSPKINRILLYTDKGKR